ncbi:DsbA family protein [Alterisphingorhabdus coralli]|uniref:Thioredoxin domain-containing protein n=1 Tax=Alterisphingorhabdus coralli TaxID=3071408 RepID=A0AA97I174_9SPHN|nr:thioredoxin domain-containing protein [Parasphingorhabdus sp. SCSIO 66989]WOE74985.1 thioredoxin domain-containing protein [Parasphingorhabdus sp. SCSIO 66989]
MLKAAAMIALIGGGIGLTTAMAEQAGRSGQSSADWTKTVRMSPTGGHIRGNPLARNRIVEFVSYTCPHCADYTEKSAVPMKTRYLPKGTASVEIRNFVRDPYDLAAALLARCGSKDRFFGNHEAILAAQQDWTSKANTATSAQRSAWQSAAMPNRLTLIARDIGLSSLMRGRGYSQTQISQCLTNQKEIDLLIKMTQSAVNDTKITGTPSFTINGRLQDKTHSWEALKPKLDRL